MRRIILDGKFMHDRESTHDYLREKLSLPAYYGRNLDALWDCLSYQRNEIIITIINLSAIYRNLGDYGRDLVDVFSEVDKEEGRVRVEFEC